ncbi:hypothetical protein [Chryseobacterium sp. PMSZPI]|uniref:hypothetical protein n=1 Tax=Chryseobacterium sp. PMSZPI TaxID=1033900 RepID=UPI000C333F24|nr:hypothetical protein [Chryseobacterium sp. PMSZPI]PKF73700.1 hypothetical protein CW752_13135 [Chryseobacterium sp. PMSZPI]
MRTCIVYFLTSLFLLFVVESKLDVKTLRNDYSGHASHHIKRANRLNQTFEKLSIQQMADNNIDNSTLELAENDFQLSDVLQVVVFAVIFSLAYIFGLKSYKQFKPDLHGFVLGLTTRRFILIRSIRI